LLLTGYASIATAVEAIKRGAHDYLAKPVDADAVVRALLDGDSNMATTMSLMHPKHRWHCAGWSGNTSSAC
jgi:ActR/RegA family two-component response regulator